MDVVYNNEPHMALFADNNGLYFYEEIIRNCQKYLNDKFILAFEIGFNQAKDIVYIINKYMKDVKVMVERDYSARDRFVFIMR